MSPPKPTRAAATRYRAASRRPSVVATTAPASLWPLPLGLAEGNVDALFPAVADEGELDPVPRPELHHEALERMLRIDHLVVDLGDDVIDPNARLRCRRSGDDLRHDDPRGPRR